MLLASITPYYSIIQKKKLSTRIYNILTHGNILRAYNLYLEIRNHHIESLIHMDNTFNNFYVLF